MSITRMLYTTGGIILSVALWIGGLFAWWAERLTLKNDSVVGKTTLKKTRGDRLLAYFALWCVAALVYFALDYLELTVIPLMLYAAVTCCFYIRSWQST